MKKKSIVILSLSVVFAVLLNYIAFFGLNVAGINYGGMFDEKKGIRKGIDLAGGSVITFQADAANPSTEDMDAVEEVFNRRLGLLGYSEARISRSEGGRITVEIPSVFDTDSAAQMLGEMAKLTFVDANGQVVLEGATAIEDASYQYAQVQEGANKEHHVLIEFTPEAKAKFAEATRSAAARKTDGMNYISIMMDAEEISRPYVETEINNSSCVITNPGFTAETARELADTIRAGQLPFKLDVITQETVGAELGANALPTAIKAAVIGIILVILFMIVMYRIPGLIASLSLLIYIGLIGLAMGLTRQNLSLSGIAGIVLSIGMAVDADCIIFERMKEELRLGKTIRSSVEGGFNKAFTAILDSNVTTIISCIVLYMSGIGTVTGFATTLGIGVVLSMFTAIVITKFLLKQLVNTGITNRSLFCKQNKQEGGAE